MLKGKTIILGITGSIAAYKAADIASKLVQAGARVEVIMTESAQKFITPLTLLTLTNRQPVTSMSRSIGNSPSNTSALGRFCRRYPHRPRPPRQHHRRNRPAA